MTLGRFSSRFESQHSSDAVRQPVTAEECLPADSSVAEVIFLGTSEAPTHPQTQSAGPVRAHGVFVPENYEPNYAYPLIVWLHDTGRSERDIANVLPRISMRNYLGLALRGTAIPRDESARGHQWSRSRRSRVEFQDELSSSVRDLRQTHHVHSERIFLAGAGEGATLAWEIFLARPQWFAGLAVLGGSFPWRDRPLRHYREMRDKTLFMAPALDDADGRDAQRVAHLMHTAGLEVSVHSRIPSQRLSHGLLRNVDRWIMKSIGGCS